MWVIIILFGAFSAWTLAGLQWVGRDPRRMAGLAALALVLGIAPRAITDWRVPLDDRYCAYDSAVAAERPEPMLADARRLTRPGLLPSFDRLDHNGPFASVGKVKDLLRVLADPSIPSRGGPWGWFLGEPPPPGGVVTWELDLSRPPFGRRDLLRPVEGAADIDLLVPGIQRLVNVNAPWDDRLLQVWGRQDDRLAAVVIFYDDARLDATCTTRKRPRSERLRAQRCWAISALLGAEEECDPGLARDHRGGDPKIRIRLRRGGVSLSIERSVGPDRLILWTGRPTDSGIELAAPIEPWDN
jgi:hypothetical protein